MNLNKMSVSPVNTFKQCPRKFYYEYVMGYRSSVVPKHLILGQAYDDILAVFDVSGREAAIEKAHTTLRDQYDLADFLYIFENHYLPYSEKNLYPPIANGNQYGFGVAPFEGADWLLTGYIDKISFEEIRGELQHVITERKTTSEPIEEGSSYWNKLALDPQIRLYVAGMRREGFRVGWVNYEVIRKVNKQVFRKIDRSLPLDEYRKVLYNTDHGKTLVANKLIYISKEMAEETLEEHCAARNMIKETASVAKSLEENGYDKKAAWFKHENSCSDYGGCPFLDVDRGVEQIEDNLKFEKKHKVLE